MIHTLSSRKLAYSMMLSVILLWPNLLSAATIVIMGDSLSAAYHMPTEQGWVALLQKRLTSQGLAYQVRNASIPGDTTAGGRSRITATIQAHKPDIVIIALGINDGLRGLSLNHMKNNLDKMITLSKKSQAKILLTAVRMPPNYGQGYTGAFRKVFTDLSSQHQIYLVPELLQGVALNNDLLQADGLHPNAKAQSIILENVWVVLKKLL